MKGKIRAYLDLIKFEHTIFALPFGLSSVVLLVDNMPALKEIFLIIIAIVLARTLGMALNRLIDEPYDRLNPRTMKWPLVSGVVSKGEVLVIIFASAFLFILVSYLLNRLAFLLSPIILILLFVYPYGKRFTHFPHIILGLIYFLIPVAVDVALNSKVSLHAIIMGIGMAFWVSGFDILYSLQDYEFDKRVGLKSLPVMLGLEKSIKVSSIFHIITLISFLLLGLHHKDLGIIYFIGLFLISILFMYQRRIIKPNDLSKLNVAFFTSNGYISIIFLFVVIADRVY